MKISSPKQSRKLEYCLYLLISFGPLAILGLLLGVVLPFSKFSGLILCFQGLASLVFFAPSSLYFILLLSLIFFMLIRYFQPDWILIAVDLWSDFYINFQNYIAGYDLLSSVNSIIAWTLLSILFVLVTLFIFVKFKYDQLYFILVLSYMVYGWYHHIDSAYAYIILYVATYALFHGLKSFNIVKANVHINKVRGIDAQFIEWFKTSLQYTAIVVVVALVLPKSSNLVEWSWLENKITEAFPSIESLRQDLQDTRTFTNATLFDFSRTGYLDESGKLGGPVTLNDTTALVVEAPYPLYLRGNVYTIYDGQSWHHGKRLKIEEDTEAFIHPEFKTGNEIFLTITNKHLASFTLFSPYQPLSISTERESKLWIDINQQITLLGARYKDESYRIRALVPGNHQETFNTPASILFNREDYLDLPATLPNRVKDLALDLSEAGETPYEKALLIQTYLRMNFPYTLETSLLPVGEDFVDYFLFTEQEGYCTYYASSLAIMLRTLDIPTRYVEGFLMPSENKNGLYEVSFANGHAWVEAYFDEIGWVTLEATPAYSIYEMPTDLITLSDANNLELYSLEDEAAYLLAMKQNRNYDTSDSVHDDNMEVEAADESHNSIDLVTKHLPFVIVFVVLFFVPARALYLMRHLNKYMDKISTHNIRTIYLYKNILELFEANRYYREIGETQKEFAKRVKRHMYDFDHDFEDVTQIFIHHKYSNIPVNEKDFMTMLNYFHFVDHRTKHKIGRLNYFKKKYLLGTLFKRYL